MRSEKRVSRNGMEGKHDFGRVTGLPFAMSGTLDAGCSWWASEDEDGERERKAISVIQDFDKLILF